MITAEEEQERQKAAMADEGEQVIAVESAKATHEAMAELAALTEKMTLEKKANDRVFTLGERDRLAEEGVDIAAEQRSRRIALLESACQEAGTNLQEAQALVSYSENHWAAQWAHW